MKRMIKRMLCLWENRGKSVKIHRTANIGLHSVFEGNNRIGAGSAFSGRMGRCSYMGADCCIEGEIGRYTSIAGRVVMTYGTHPTSMVSTSPVFYSSGGAQCGKTYVDRSFFPETVYADSERKLRVMIGNDVWIGYGAIILSGVRIGNGAVIAAGAVVTEDVPSYAIVGGIPAKLIRYRFSKEQIKQLEEIRWWESDEEELRQKAETFRDPQLFLENERKSGIGHL